MLMRQVQSLVAEGLLEYDIHFGVDGAADDDAEQHKQGQVAPSGMSPHQLRLKEGAPIVLLQHMLGAHGQANGPRLVICRENTRVIEANIVTGCSVGSIVYIPHINSTNTDSQLPFKSRRRQSPVRLAFAMTITGSDVS
ncbi:TPA: hypothetical protein ACH3X2_14273 [Trebouxia sp. C0005]